jgi:hypothetical protein
MAIVEQEHLDRAEKLLSGLEAWRPDVVSVAPSQSAAADIAAVAQALADAESASDKGGWIACSERTPPVGVYVETFSKHRAPTPFGIGRYDNVEALLRGPVTHWRLLPQPPPEGE